MKLSVLTNQETTSSTQDYSLPIDGALHHENFLPASSIVDPDHNELGNLIAKEKLLFCYRAILRTIDSCLSKKYSNFDGHTTSNCCHGMALLAQNLINSVLQCNLIELREEGEQKIASLEQQTEARVQCIWWAPKALINLSCLYILAFVKESDPLKGGRTVTKKLREISPISVNACNEIAHKHQKLFSNWIALQYHVYFEMMDKKFEINNATVEVWGKYVSPEYIRTDKRGLKYCSNLFSMEISLAHLILSKAKIALINDIHDSSGALIDRFVSIFEGDGERRFVPLAQEEIRAAAYLEANEPIVVFGGCVYSDTLDIDSLSLRIEPWLNQFPSLMLACDVFYPQFFKVTDDTEFDNSPVIPEEKTLQENIESHRCIQGVSSSDPSLYCATHIYPASLEQVVNILSKNEINALPVAFIPGVKKIKNSETSSPLSDAAF
jgi:hypothetical protein